MWMEKQKGGVEGRKSVAQESEKEEFFPDENKKREDI